MRTRQKVDYAKKWLVRSPESPGAKTYFYLTTDRHWKIGLSSWDEAMSFESRDAADELLLPMKIIHDDDQWQGAYAYEQIMFTLTREKL